MVLYIFHKGGNIHIKILQNILACFLGAGVIVIPCAVRVALVVAVLKILGITQPKCIHRFSPNFQDIFIPRGSRAD